MSVTWCTVCYRFLYLKFGPLLPEIYNITSVVLTIWWLLIFRLYFGY